MAIHGAGQTRRRRCVHLSKGALTKCCAGHIPRCAGAAPVSLGYRQTGKGLQTCWSSVTSRLRKSRDGENRLSLNNWHGYFTCVAEADEVEAALKKFKATCSRVWS